MRLKPNKNAGGGKREGRRLNASRVSRELEELNRIGIALYETRDVDRLLGMILQKAREVTVADAGSLYMLERTAGNANLRFKLTQKDRVEFAFTALTLLLTYYSMPGHC